MLDVERFYHPERFVVYVLLNGDIIIIRISVN